MMSKTARKFETAEAMQDAVDAYFAPFEAEDYTGKRRPSLARMAVHLGFSCLRALRQYDNYDDDDYRSVLDTAKLRCQAFVEERGSTSFDMFLLKNYEPDFWRDKTEVDQNVVNKELMDPKVRTARLEALIDRAKERVLDNVEIKQIEDAEWDS